MEETKQRRRFQFSLRAMLVLMTVASVFFAWLAAEARTVQQRKATIARIEQQSPHNLFAHDDLEMFFAIQPSQRGPSIGTIDRAALVDRCDSVPHIPLVRRILGDQPVYFAVVVNPGDVQQIQSQFPESLVVAYKEVPKPRSTSANLSICEQP